MLHLVGKQPAARQQRRLALDLGMQVGPHAGEVGPLPHPFAPHDRLGAVGGRADHVGLPTGPFGIGHLDGRRRFLGQVRGQPLGLLSPDIEKQNAPEGPHPAEGSHALAPQLARPDDGQHGRLPASQMAGGHGCSRRRPVHGRQHRFHDQQQLAGIRIVEIHGAEDGGQPPLEVALALLSHLHGELVGRLGVTGQTGGNASGQFDDALGGKQVLSLFELGQALLDGRNDFLQVDLRRHFPASQNDCFSSHGIILSKAASIRSSEVA